MQIDHFVIRCLTQEPAEFTETELGFVEVGFQLKHLPLDIRIAHAFPAIRQHTLERTAY